MLHDTNCLTVSIFADDWSNVNEDNKQKQVRIQKAKDEQQAAKDKVDLKKFQDNEEGIKAELTKLRLLPAEIERLKQATQEESSAKGAAQSETANLKTKIDELNAKYNADFPENNLPIDFNKMKVLIMSPGGPDMPMMMLDSGGGECFGTMCQSKQCI